MNQKTNMQQSISEAKSRCFQRTDWNCCLLVRRKGEGGREGSGNWYQDTVSGK